MGNEIIIRNVFGKVNQVYFINPCKNPKTGRYPDCVKSVNSNGDMILSESDIKEMSAGTKHFIPETEVFQIVDGTVYDLDDVVDAAKWEAIKFCSWIAKDRTEKNEKGELVIDGGAKRYGTANLYVERPGQIAKTRVNKEEIIFNAKRYIFEDSESERVKKAKVLGRDLRLASPADVLDYLLEIANKNPKKIMDVYEGEDWKMQLFLIDAVDRGVVRKTEGLIKYDDKVLGASTEAAVAFLKDIRYKAIRDSIRRETYPELLPKDQRAVLQDEVDNDLSHLDPKPEETKSSGNKGKK